MLSQLFADDALLQTIADDGDRISQTQHSDDPAVGKIQTALLIWDPSCLPNHGADGNYGSETAGAVVQFKVNQLGVDPATVVNDVGPQTVLRLDQIAAVAETVSAAGVVMIGGSEDLGPAIQAVETANGDILMGLGPRAAVVSSGQDVLDALAPLVGSVLAGVVTPAAPELPAAVDADTATLVTAWLSGLDPSVLLSHLDPNRQEQSFEPLGGCALAVQG
jgi:peptidoglycan hydrolase-like protein with peptidoglycan-binding domain